MVTGLAAIMGLILVIVAKFFTTAQIQRIRRKVAEEQTTNSKIKTELRVAESTKAVALQNLKTEERIQRSLNLQIDKNKTDLANLKK
ncbi:MAG: ABC-type protease/lipase transport system fused ATPase/permease subunit [Candidatus Latescibacterota bacterium]|jgi:ABC-type protease/lipase transport system fused ATPase/permease subunit